MKNAAIIRKLKITIAIRRFLGLSFFEYRAPVGLLPLDDLSVLRDDDI